MVFSNHIRSLDRFLYRGYKSMAFCFDIDGVLLRGGKPLECARKALSRLYGNEGTPRVPICFLTNGGGVSEDEKARELSEAFGLHIHDKQIVLSHTPFRGLDAYKNSPALIVGRKNSLNVAQKYGFRYVYTASILAELYPSSVPFLMRHDTSVTNTAGSRESRTIEEIRREGVPPIENIFIFTDPCDWYLELQVILDLLQGGGVMGTHSHSQDHGHMSMPIIPRVFCSHSDLVWSNDFPVPRLGLGAFLNCVKSTYHTLTGRQLDVTVFGKPQIGQYKFAEDVLLQQLKRKRMGRSYHHNALEKNSLEPIYAIGDNPQVDVKGSNNAGWPWVSILVRTGVFTQQGNCPVDPANIVVDNVYDAIDAALHHSRNLEWHSMR